MEEKLGEPVRVDVWVDGVDVALVDDVMVVGVSDTVLFVCVTEETVMVGVGVHSSNLASASCKLKISR